VIILLVLQEKQTVQIARQGQLPAVDDLPVAIAAEKPAWVEVPNIHRGLMAHTNVVSVGVYRRESSRRPVDLKRAVCGRTARTVRGEKWPNPIGHPARSQLT
jgi:hypothetical protein